MAEIKELLKKISLFNGLEESDIDKIAQVVETGTVPVGTEFFKEGDIGDAFYILNKGDVDVLKKENGTQKLLTTIKATDENCFFGEMALIEGLPRNATIIAKSECEILEIEKKNFDMLLRINSFIALRIMTALTKRLRADNIAPATAATSEKQLSAKIVSFFSPKGGSGKTTLAVSVAAGIAKYLKKKVLLIDLDLQFGGIDFMLKLKAKNTIADLTDSASYKSYDDIKHAIISHDSGISLLPSPLKTEQSENVDSGHLRKIISLCRNQYDYIIIDTHSLLHDMTINTLDLSDFIMLIMNPDVINSVAIHDCLNVMDGLKYPKEKINLILNRAEQPDSISSEQIDGMLSKQNFKIKYMVHEDRRACSDLINDGKMMFDSSSQGKFKNDIANIITGITGEKLPDAAKSGGQNIFSKFNQWLNS